MTTNNVDFGEFIEFSISKRFGIIKLNRVHRANALTIDMTKNLKKAIQYCQKNEKFRGILLTGNGSKIKNQSIKPAFSDMYNFKIPCR